MNTRAQQVLVRVLRGEETGAVSVQGDQVVLDVSEVIDQVKQRLVARGLTIVENVPIPDVDKQIVLLDAPQLKQARTIYAFANPLARWLIVVVAGLYLAALLLSRRRPRMTVDHRGWGWRRTPCWWRWRCRSAVSCSSTSWPERCSGRRARCSSTRCWLPPARVSR